MGTPYEQGCELHSVFTSTTGGVLTVEAGAVTGDLEAATSVEKGTLEISVRYADAEDWYTVAGSPATLAHLASAGGERSHGALHREAVRALTTPGTVRGGNEQPTDLRRLTDRATSQGE